MIEIPLTQGQTAIVDDEDAHLASMRWYAEKREQTYYATRNLPKEKGRRAGVIRLHTAVLGRPLPFFEIDHINGNGLDCRRANLRLVFPRENQANRRKHRTKTYTQFKGVFWHKTHRTWWSQIKTPSGIVHLGVFPTDEAAARAYDRVASEAFGTYARLNFPAQAAAL